MVCVIGRQKEREGGRGEIMNGKENSRIKVTFNFPLNSDMRKYVGRIVVVFSNIIDIIC